MGTFGGHALPGSFFIVFALWWTVQTYRRYYQSLSPSGKRYASSITFPCSCLCGRLSSWEIEGFLKILFTAVGFALEIYTGFKDGEFVYLGNGQHATMFFFFAMSGVVDLLVHYKTPLPRGIGYVAMGLALTVEGLLFSFHSHGREPLENLLHSLLVYSVGASVVALGVEMCHRRHVLAALARSYCTLLQGTWFWQAGYILYNPLPGARPWDQASEANTTIVTMIFTWHMAGAFLVVTLIGAVIGCVYRAEPDSQRYDALSMNLISQSPTGQTMVNLSHGDSDDSDIEYEKPVTLRD